LFETFLELTTLLAVAKYKSGNLRMIFFVPYLVFAKILYYLRSSMPRSLLMESSSSSLFQSPCAHLTPYGHQHHCEKQIPSCIHDKSILLLGRLGLDNVDASKMGRYAIGFMN
jgi:hypothetical protein